MRMTRPAKHRKLACARCHHKGYKIIRPAPDGRPQFKCDRCGEEWSCGHSGGGYVEFAMNKAEWTNPWPMPKGPELTKWRQKMGYDE